MSAGSGGVTLLHELMGLMRRSLTQQAPIRQALYQVSPMPVTNNCLATYQLCEKKGKPYAS